MGSWSYVSRDALKAQLADTLTTNDSLYREKLEAASEEVDDRCRRTFRIHLATLYLAARFSDHVTLDEDLLAVTSLKTDEDGDRTYEITWLSTDYDLEPDNAAVHRRPYWKVTVTPEGAQTFPVGVRRGVELVARLGYWQDLGSAGTLGAAISTTDGTSVTMTSGHGLEALQTILIDAEQLYVTSVATNTLTVERGVNGTVAATHLNSAAVQRYRYPRAVVDATKVLAEELLRPFGLTGRVDDTQRPAFVVLPKYVEDALSPYKLLAAA